MYCGQEQQNVFPLLSGGWTSLYSFQIVAVDINVRMPQKKKLKKN